MLAGIGEVQLQNILALHCKLSHCSMHKCAVMLGLKLRHHHMLRLYCKYCAMGKLKNAPIGQSLPPPKRVLYRLYMDGTGPYVESYFRKYKYALQLFDQFTEFTISLHDQKRGALLERAKSIMINATQRHHPYCIVELRCDGLPEQASGAFRTWCEQQHIDLKLGAPYAHHHQSHVEKSHSTVYSRSHERGVLVVRQSSCYASQERDCHFAHDQRLQTDGYNASTTHSFGEVERPRSFELRLVACEHTSIWMPSGCHCARTQRGGLPMSE